MTTEDHVHNGEKEAKKSSQKRIATLDNPLIEAIFNGLFRFTDKEQAMRRVQEIRNEFVVAREQEGDKGAYNIRLWIKDYDLSEEEIKQGYRGHFGGISIMRLNTGKYSLKLTKIDVPLAQHPQKTRSRRSHPDWGHRILRQLEKNPVFDDVEKARAMLMALHEEYPNISIPGFNHLYIMIYRKDRSKDGGIPVQKFKFNIVPYEGGKFQIQHQENVKRPKGPVIREMVAADQPTEGHFTAMIKLKRKKKRNTRIKPKTEDSAST